MGLDDSDDLNDSDDLDRYILYFYIKNMVFFIIFYILFTHSHIHTTSYSFTPPRFVLSLERTRIKCTETEGSFVW